MGKRSAPPAVPKAKKAKSIAESTKDDDFVGFDSDSDSNASMDASLSSESEDDLDELDSMSSGSEDESNASESGKIDESDGTSSSDDLHDDEDEVVNEENKLSAEEKREQRMKQKEQQRERKLQKAHGKEIAEIKQLWEKMRTKALRPEVRRTVVDDAYALADQQGWAELVFRHDSSRVVQSIFKYATKEQRAHITKALRGRYVELAKSSYGKYLLVKMLHYGSSKLRSSILDELHGNFRKLMSHREGAYVVEDAFRDYATAPQRRQMLREFYGSEFAVFKDKAGDAADLTEILERFPEKRPYLMDNLNRVITAAVNKGSIGFEIMHAAMLEYVRNLDLDSSDREIFVDLVADQIAEMVHTSAGSQVAALVFAIATAKERKRLLRALREFTDKLAKDQFGQFVLTTIFAVVDDTVLVHRALGSRLEEQMPELVVHRYARRPLLYLLVGQSPKYFVAVKDRFEEVAKFATRTSKKDPDTRRKELLASFAPAMLAAVPLVDAKDTLGMQFIGDLISKVDDDVEGRDEAINSVIRALSGNPNDPDHPIKANPISSRVAKLLVKTTPAFAEALVTLAEEFPLEWATGEGNFAIIALLESRPELARNLKKLLKPLRKSIEAESRAQGRDLLLKLLK